MKIVGHLFWGAVAVLAAVCLAGIAINRGEPVNSMWMVVGAACTYAVGYRFYAKFIAARVMFLNDKRATPAERLRDGLDFEPTNKWIAFGHHFAAIAGPGPLVGPVLAAQFGYLPGTLWIIIGAVTFGTLLEEFKLLSKLINPLLKRTKTTGSLIAAVVAPHGPISSAAGNHGVFRGRIS